MNNMKKKITDLFSNQTKVVRFEIPATTFFATETVLKSFVEFFYGKWKVDSESPYTHRNPIESNRNQIVFTMHRLIWNQMDVRLVPNQSICQFKCISQRAQQYVS